MSWRRKRHPEKHPFLFAELLIPFTFPLGTYYLAVLSRSTYTTLRLLGRESVRITSHCFYGLPMSVTFLFDNTVVRFGVVMTSFLVFEVSAKISSRL